MFLNNFLKHSMFTVVVKSISVRALSQSGNSKQCKLLVVGGGTGGCSIAAKFTSKLGKNNVIVIDPAEKHYYQPMFTMIGGGMKTLQDSCKEMHEVLPRNCEWIKDQVVEFQPKSNHVITKGGTKVHYDYLVIATGIQLDYEKIPGLLEALSAPGSGVCSNYSPTFVNKTYESLKNFKEGNMIFTFPNTPIKCAGAPQKICYIAEHYLRLHKRRENANIMYNTSLGVIFGVKKYADSLWKICEARNIKVNLRTNLTEIQPDKKVAVFENLDDKTKQNVPYSFLHVTPPMSAPPVLKTSPDLTDGAGYLNVDKFTLRHLVYDNIFGIGDCTNLPTSKTAAACAAQAGVVSNNLSRVMKDELPSSQYNGYTSCPLVTGYSSCVLAEFDYNLQPHETFPFDQSKESSLMFYLKKDMMPLLYWQGMLRGLWNGPATMKKLMSFGLSKS